MKKRQLRNLGIPNGPLLLTARAAVSKAHKSGLDNDQIHRLLEAVVAEPKAFLTHDVFGALAQGLDKHMEERAAESGYESAAAASNGGRVTGGGAFEPRERPAPYRKWGQNLDPESIQQMENACELPIAVRGALMPDAHVGYGLPIGGVLATRNAVIPYAVGVDIACRMKMTALDLPVTALKGQVDRLTKTLTAETRFGIGAAFHSPRQHRVMDEDWDVSPVTARMKDKAWAQLGTSGSGNHFVEFGILTIEREGLELDPGSYLALLSHSGSRGVGNEVARFYSRLAMDLRRRMPRHLQHLAWLDLNTEPGVEYWNAMQLMGRYASANHELIHRHIARALGAEVILDVENHHNFAWEETHDGERVIVHRKGATPAGRGGLGVIRMSGSDARAIAERVLRFRRPPLWRAWSSFLAELAGADGAAVDEVVVTYFPAPRSYTAENVVEISCHGSPVVLRFALERLAAAGEPPPSCAGDLASGRTFILSGSPGGALRPRPPPQRRPPAGQPEPALLVQPAQAARSQRLSAPSAPPRAPSRRCP